jgi:hypothetical protein
MFQHLSRCPFHVSARQLYFFVTYTAYCTKEESLLELYLHLGIHPADESLFFLVQYLLGT